MPRTKRDKTAERETKAGKYEVDWARVSNLAQDSVVPGSNENQLALISLLNEIYEHRDRAEDVAMHALYCAFTKCDTLHSDAIKALLAQKGANDAAN